MTRMTGPDCVVMCNLINTHTVDSDVIYHASTRSVILGKYCPGFPFQVPCMAADIKTSIFIAKKKSEFYMRHRTIRDRSVSSTVYLSHIPSGNPFICHEEVLYLQPLLLFFVVLFFHIKQSGLNHTQYYTWFSL